ncbi:hypothetical protein AAH446_08060 [Erwinia sp. P6884]|uniref:hypothetical protein n=1 Tax=Erwinia sp. P6884 TaxID=3141450 RepID=UPI00318500D3
MKTLTVTYNGLSFDAEFSETSTADKVDKTLVIPVNDQSTAAFDALPDGKRFSFGGDNAVSGDYILTEKAPAHYIFTNS